MKIKETELGVRKGYEIWSETYDSDKNPLIELEEKPLLKVIGDVKNKTVLDACCGTGRVSLRLLELGAKVCGIDISPRMLQKAKKKTEKFKDRCEFTIASIYKIPYAQKKFNIVICNLAISHLKNLDRAVSQMSRVLKPKGVLIISDLHPSAVGTRTNFVQHNKWYKIKNYYHSFEDFFDAFSKNNLRMVETKEPRITKKSIEYVVKLYKKYGKDVSKDYRKYIGEPVVIIIKLEKMR